MEYPPNDDDQPYFATPTNKSNTYYPQQQLDTSYPLHQPKTSPYEPLQAPVPPKSPKRTPGWLVAAAIGVLVGIICVVFGSQAGTPASSSDATPTPATSIVDQVTQAFSTYTNPPLITAFSADSVLVEYHGTGDPSGQAETTSQAVNTASDYQKTIWQADITGLSSVTVVMVQTDYPGVNGTTNIQDLVKCIVTSATGSSLDWNSGTPMQRFQQFDVKWVIGQGTEP